MKRITLIRTSPPFPPGSMSVCALMLEQALGNGASIGMRIRFCSFFDPAAGGSMRRHHLWRLRHARSFFNQHPSDLYHLIDGSMAGFLPREIQAKTVVTVHDLIPLLQMQGRLPGRPGPAGRWMIARSLAALRHAAGLAAVSEQTRRDLAEQTGRDDIAVIPNPVRRLKEASAPVFSDLPEQYLFHVGNNAFYKNRAGVLDVFERLQDLENLHLVMAGPEPPAGLRRRADQLKRVRFFIDVPEAGLAELYRKASVFLFPSLYEGFGMPVLEAMSAGCPVVCSSAASLPEVAGGAALTAPPEDIGQMARHCRTLLTDPVQRSQITELGKQHCAKFTLDRLADSLRVWYVQNLNQSEVRK